MDFIIALTLFLLIVFLSFKYMMQDYAFSARNKNEVLLEADRISNSLITEGMPVNWTEEKVYRLGLTTNGAINQSKVEMFRNLTFDDYANVKTLLNVKSDFLIYFENKNGNMINFTEEGYIGKSGHNTISAELISEEVVKLSRFITYRHDNIAEIIMMNIFVWEEK